MATKSAAKSAPRRAARSGVKTRPRARAASDGLAPRPRPATQSVPADHADRANRWVVLIYMAVTSPELRGLMEADLAEMTTRLRLLGPNDLRVYALMDTPEGKYTVRHRVHHSETEPDHEIMRLEEGAASRLPRTPRLPRKAAFLANLISWRFGGTTPGQAATDVSTFGKTLLILWGHSQGVATALSKPGSPAYAMVGNGGFGFNEFSGDSLSLPQIRRAISAGLPSDERLPDDRKSRIDILSFDSCFMSAAEVSAEFQPQAPPFDRRKAVRADEKPALREARENARDAARRLGDDPARVDFVVASQSAVLLDGLDYGRLVDVFVEASPANVTAETLGRHLLEQASSTTDSPVSLSMIYTGRPGPYAAFQERFRELVDQLSFVLDTSLDPPNPDTPPERKRRGRESDLEVRDHAVADVPGPNRSEWLRIRDAFDGAAWHRVRQFIDVGDLCRRLANNCRKPELRTAAIGVLGTLHPSAGAHSDELVVDVRSLHPLLLSGLSIYCPWLFPTPEEVRKGAWNAVVDLYDYATDLWFNRAPGSWGAFLYNAKHVLEESRQRAINTELADLREVVSRSGAGEPHPSAEPPSPVARFRDKGGRDGFQVAEAGQAAGPATAPAAPLPVPPMSFRARFAERAAAQGQLDQVPICPKR